MSLVVIAIDSFIILDASSRHVQPEHICIKVCRHFCLFFMTLYLYDLCYHFELSPFVQDRQEWSHLISLSAMCIQSIHFLINSAFYLYLDGK